MTDIVAAFLFGIELCQLSEIENGTITDGKFGYCA